MPDSVQAPPSAPPRLLSADEARAFVGSYPPVSPLAALKDIGRLDPHLARFIGMAPICFVSTSDAEGQQDVTPRGDPPGSFKVIDEHTLAFPDRPGNNRLDTLKNLVENPEIALVFLLPGTNETARVAGTARLSTDPELLASMAVQGKAPLCAVVVAVRQAYFHCAKALLRSKLWEPHDPPGEECLPCAARMLVDQLQMPEYDVATMQQMLDDAYRDNLY